MRILRVARLYLLLAAVIISLISTRASARQPMSLQFDATFKPDYLAFRPAMSTNPAVFLISNRSPAAQGEHTVVRLVIFWLDSCGHCHYVLEEVLPPLREKYGTSLEIRLIEVKSAEDIDRLYQTASDLGIAKENVAVPFLIIGDQVLIGSTQIPAELPGLIDQYMNEGGVDYPDLQPVNEDLVEGQADTLPAEPDAGQPVSNGFTLAILILVGMLISLAYTGIAFVRGAERQCKSSRQGWRDYVIPLLAVLGLGVASYLSYVETQAVPAICGPVGNCNAVQSSSYARLFGILPIGILGTVGYALILAFWVWAKLRPDRTGQFASLGIFGMALFGTLFSLYLTFLEPFVIRAVCIWCLSSAVVITLVLLVSIQPALGYWSLGEN